LKPAEHHERKKKQQRRQNEFPVAEVMFALGQPEKEKRDRCDETSSRGNGKAGEILFAIGIGRLVIGSCGIETSQTQRAAGPLGDAEV
jgi:hypothetical protein